MSMFRLLLETLNSELEDELTVAGRDVLEAVDVVAAEWGLRLVAEDGQCRVYWVRDQARYINCWLEGALSDKVEEGGVGFDDQIEWWEEIV